MILHFHLYHTNQLLGKRGSYNLNGLHPTIIKICTKPLRQWVLCGRFSIITHKSPPWKKGAIRFEWTTSKNFRYMHETTQAMGFMRSLFRHYYGLWSPLRDLVYLYARFDYLHCLFCKIGVNSVNMVAFTLFTPFTPNVSVNGVNIENRVYHK